MQGSEKHLPELLRRTNIKGRACGRVDFGREPVQLVLHIRKKGFESSGVNGHASFLHIGQHRRQRKLQRIVKIQQAVLRHPVFQSMGHTQSLGGRTHALELQRSAPARCQPRPAIVASSG